jgi:predicted Rossmann-fold nucleotide-binding protein
MRICIYRASSAQAPAHFGDAAYELGRLPAANNVTVVYGGGGTGSMGRLADGVLQGKGEITGVMPRFMKDLEWANSKVQTIFWTNDMAERKARKLENTDA